MQTEMQPPVSSLVHVFKQNECSGETLSVSRKANILNDPKLNESKLNKDNCF